MKVSNRFDVPSFTSTIKQTDDIDDTPTMCEGKSGHHRLEMISGVYRMGCKEVEDNSYFLREGHEVKGS